MEVVPTADGEEDGVIWLRCPGCQGYLPKIDSGGLSSRRQEELSELLARVLALPPVTDLNPDPRTRRVHYDWLEAGEHTIGVRCPGYTVAERSSSLLVSCRICVMVPSVGPTGPGGSFLALAQLFAENAGRRSCRAGRPARRKGFPYPPRVI